MTVTVNVVDELGLPVENAQVSIKKSGSGRTVGVKQPARAARYVVSLEEEATATAYKPGYLTRLRAKYSSEGPRKRPSGNQTTIGTGVISYP